MSNTAQGPRRGRPESTRSTRLLRSTVGGLIALLVSGCTERDSGLGGSRSFDRSIALEDVAETSANVSLGDLDGDGHLDVVLVKGRHWPLLDLVLMGDGAGGFEPARPVGGTPDRSYSGVLVDLDGDGHLDLVVSNDDPDPKIVHLNVGDGHFEVGSTFETTLWGRSHTLTVDFARSRVEYRDEALTGQLPYRPEITLDASLSFALSPGALTASARHVGARRSVP